MNERTAPLVVSLSNHERGHSPIRLAQGEQQGPDSFRTKLPVPARYRAALIKWKWVVLPAPMPG
jgi:hypothetical protein